MVVILPARNEATPASEGNKLADTVTAVRAAKAPGTRLRFAVFDDGSTDFCADPLIGNSDVTLRTQPEPRGQGVNRNLGVWLHPGARIYVSMDSHMAVDPCGLEQMALTAEETGALVGCMSTNLGKPSDPTRRAGNRWKVKGAGDSLDIGCRAINGEGIAWNYAKKDDPTIKPTDVTRGACYAFTQDCFDTFGPFGESYGYYGFFDHDTSIRLYFTGRQNLVDISVKAPHYYRVQRPYSSSCIWRWWGYVECLRSLFRPDVWRRVFQPAALVMARESRDPMLIYLLHDPRFDAIQGAFEARKTRSDEEVLAWMGIE